MSKKNKFLDGLHGLENLSPKQYQLKKRIRREQQLSKTKEGRVKLQEKTKEYRLRYKKVLEARKKAFQNPLVRQVL